MLVSFLHLFGVIDILLNLSSQLLVISEYCFSLIFKTAFILSLDNIEYGSFFFILLKREIYSSSISLNLLKLSNKYFLM